MTTDAVNTLHFTADLVKRWGKIRLSNGETLEATLTIDGGVSLWQVVAPILAAFILPKDLARKTLLPFFPRVIRPYLAWAKQHMRYMYASPKRSQRTNDWPTKPVLLFLGFSGYMYRDILSSVADYAAKNYHMDYVVIHDDGWFQESVVKLQGREVHAVWEHWDQEVAAHELKLRHELAAKVRYLKQSKIVSVLVDNNDAILMTNLDATFKWLYMTYLPSLLPYVALTRHILAEHRPVAIISPDVTDRRTRLFCIIGKNMGIPSLEVQFGMYAKDSVEWQFLVADRVAVWGESARQVLRGHNVGEERMTLTGSPRFDHLINVPDTEIAKVRSRLRIPDNQMMVLFASMYSLDHYSQFGNFSQILVQVKQAILRAVHKIDGVCLVVKPHPLEKVKETQKLASGLKNIIFAEPAEDIRELTKACDVFITLGSTSTMDALIARKLVIFPAFPGLVWWDDMYLKCRATYEASSEAELVRCLQAVAEGQREKMLAEKESARQAFLHEQVYRTDGQASARIAKLTMQMAGI